MRMRAFRAGCILLFSVCMTPLFSQGASLPRLNTLIAEDTLNSLRYPQQDGNTTLHSLNPDSAHSLTSMFYKETPKLSLFPRTGQMQESDFMTALPSGEKPDLVVESLYLLEIPNSSENISDHMKKISDIFRSFSKMEGMRYVSSSGKVETLYHKSYTINNEKEKKQIPDNLSAALEGLTLYNYQNDNSFGDCIYRVDYSTIGNSIKIRLTAADDIKYGIIRAMKKDNLTIDFIAVPAEDGILLYSLVQAHFINMPFIGKRISRSFKSRTDSIFQWFVDSYRQ